MNQQTGIRQVYGISEWAGEMAIAISPLLILVGMVMVTVSILLKGVIATQVYFEVPWAIIQAITVDGLWLGIWIRLHAAKLGTWPLRAKYTAMLFVAILMFAVGTSMSILVTYQEVNGVSDVLAAMGHLHISGDVFVISRGILVMLCATLAIPFRAHKYIPPVEQSIPAPVKKSTVRSTVKIPTVPARIPEKVTITEDKQPEGIRLLPSPDAEKSTAGYEQSIRRYMAEHEVYTYKDVSTATGASIPTVKKWVPKIRKEA